MHTLTTHINNKLSDILPDIGIIYLKERFFSENDSSELHIQIGLKGILGYRKTPGDNKIYGGKNTPEEETLLWIRYEDIGIGKISMLNSLGYCIGTNGIAWIDLDTGNINMYLLFKELEIGTIQKINTIQNIGYGRGGIFKFRKDRKLTERIIGDTLTNRLHSDIELGPVEWKHTAEEIGIGSIEKIFPNYEGNIVIGTEGFCIINNKGTILLANKYEALGFTEIVQIYRNGWIVGLNSAIQIDFHTGNHVSPLQDMDIKHFITFSKNNKHSLMEESNWDDIIIKENPIDTIESGVSQEVRKITK